MTKKFSRSITTKHVIFTNKEGVEITRILLEGKTTEDDAISEFVKKHWDKTSVWNWETKEDTKIYEMSIEDFIKYATPLSDEENAKRLEAIENAKKNRQ